MSQIPSILQVSIHQCSLVIPQIHGAGGSVSAKHDTTIDGLWFFENPGVFFGG
jgi:hypothetical protein